MALCRHGGDVEEGGGAGENALTLYVVGDLGVALRSQAFNFRMPILQDTAAMATQRFLAKPF